MTIIISVHREDCCFNFSFAMESSIEYASKVLGAMFFIVVCTRNSEMRTESVS